MKYKRLLANLSLCVFVFSSILNINLNSKSRNVAYAHLCEEHIDTLFNNLIPIQKNNLYQKDNFCSYYFSHLNENIPNNLYGSCGYTSMAMLLSFYDTYSNDSIIPNNYDITTSFNISDEINRDYSYAPLNASSPGVKFESKNFFNSISINEYISLTGTYKNTYFQFKLFDLAKKCFNSPNLNNDLGLDNIKIKQLFDYYLYDYRHFNRSNIELKEIDVTLTMSYIKEGKPLILFVKDLSNNDIHTVIGYDYDSVNNQIYVHTGWRNEDNNNSLNHISLNDLGYTEILNAFYLDVSLTKELGNKYFVNGQGYSAFSFVYPHNIRLVSGNYIDLNPTFYWDSVKDEKLCNLNNLKYSFTVLNQNDETIYYIDNIITKEYTIPTNVWKNIRENISGNSYFVYVSCYKNTESNYMNSGSRKEFEKPQIYRDLPSLNPTDFGYEDAYPTDNDTKEQFILHNIRDFKFETRRYRTGYIHNEDIVLSCIRKNINEAFLEFRFEWAINRMDVALSYWRDASLELLNSNNGKAVIQQYIDDGWVDVFDLLASETALPEDRTNKTTYTLEFSRLAYRIRFYLKSNSDNSLIDRNLGRICIGSMVFYKSDYNLPLSGGELDYIPEFWNEEYLKKRVNCYAYALNTIYHFDVNIIFGSSFIYPGWTDGDHRNELNYLVGSNIERLVSIDASHCNFTFREVEKNERCSQTAYKIALAIAPDQDFHWYRQNSDGTWSHKPGNMNVMNADYLDDVIYDPEICDRRWLYDYFERNYSDFIGFYEIDISNCTLQKGG